MHMLARFLLALAIAGSAGVAGADWGRHVAGFIAASPSSWQFCRFAATTRRPACVLNLRMARGARRGGRGGARGGGAVGPGGRGAPSDDDEFDAERSGKGSRRGKASLNQLLTKKNTGMQASGAPVGNKLQDFDPKKMERGTVRFLGSFDSDAPKLGLPEVAFVGRSNVGKSSLLNCLTNSKIAVTSKTPGRTQRVNIFAWKESKKAGRVVGMVDLPGFGFAKVSRGAKAQISDQLGKYIAEREALKLVVVLVDLRVEPQKADLDAMELLFTLDVPFIVVGTKAGMHMFCLLPWKPCHARKDRIRHSAYLALSTAAIRAHVFV